MKRPAREKTALRPGLSGRGPALVAGLLWLLAGLSAGYWVLLAVGRSPVVPVTAAVPLHAVSDVASVARALGAVAVAPAAEQAPVAVASRYSLLGVVDQSGVLGAALIAIDGHTPRPYRVGAALEGGLVLQAVARRSVRLGPALEGPATVELSLPVPAAN